MMSSTVCDCAGWRWRSWNAAWLLALVLAIGMTGAGCQVDDTADQGAEPDVHSDPAADVARTSLTRVGDLAPDFTVTTLTADTLSLAAQRGKVVLVNFFATWCPPCKAELPYLEKDVWQRFRGEDFVMVGIAREESADIIRPFQKAQEVTYPFAPDADRSVFARYASSYIPRNYVIGRDGTILYQSQGFEAEEFAAMVAVIEAELARPVVWPEAMIRLLPENPQLLVAVENLTRLDSELAALAAKADSLTGETTMPADYQLAARLAWYLPEAAEVMDPDRPLAVAAVLEPLGSQPPVGLAFALPRRAGISEEELRTRMIDYPLVEVTADYFVVATSASAGPAGVLPSLAWDLPVDDLVLRIDLAEIMATLGPFIRMGLASMESSAGAGDQRHLREAAVRELTGGFMDAVTRLEFQASLRDGILSLRDRLTFLPGSALDPGPQPSFTQALDLLRPQLADTTIVVISALDPSRLLDRFPALSELLLLQDVAQAGAMDEADARALLEKRLTAARLWGGPLAQTTAITTSGLYYTMVLQPDDPASLLTELIGVYSAPAPDDVSWTLVETEGPQVAGHQARRFELDFDWQDLLREAADDSLPARRARAVAEDSERLMRALVPPFWTIDTEQFLVLVGDRKADSLEQIMHRLATGEGSVPSAVTTAVAWAGPGTQLLMVGGIERMMRGMQALSEETFGSEPTALDLAWARSDSIPIAAIPTIVAAGLQGHSYEGRLRIDAAALIDILAALDQP